MMGQKGVLNQEEVLTDKKSVPRNTNAGEDALDCAAFRSNFTQGDGIIMMSVRDIFRQIALEGDKTFSVSCSFLEIYNDVVHDLLTTTEKLSDELQIIEINVRLAANDRMNSLRRARRKK